nr:hypothetical protein BCU62_15645 [Enterovibrio norvegicus]
MLRQNEKELVISDSDIEVAIAHLNSLPQTVTCDMPKKWAKQQFIEWLKESLPNNIEYGVNFDVATGIFGHIVPLGHGYSMHSDDNRYLIILSVRSVDTDLSNLNKL